MARQEVPGLAVSFTGLYHGGFYSTATRLMVGKSGLGREKGLVQHTSS